MATLWRFKTVISYWKSFTPLYLVFCQMNTNPPEKYSSDQGMAIRWGIVGPGKISHDFVIAMSYLCKLDHQVVAVASNELDRAEQFKHEFGIPRAYGSYEELAKDPEVDVAYIGVIHPNHFSASKLMLENGKHVLCEKPMCMNAKQVKELVRLAEEKNLFLMEGIWSRFFPAYKEVQRILKNNEIGEVYHVSATFGTMSTSDRLKLKELGGGTILDLGVYVLQLATMVFGNEPSDVVGSGHLNENGVDETVMYSLKYCDGKTASFVTSSKVKLKNTAYIYGTEGYIEICEPFWSPTVIKTSCSEKCYPLKKPQEKLNFRNSMGLKYEAEEVRACILKNLIESPSLTHKESIALAQIEDKIREDVGVQYQSDEGGMKDILKTDEHDTTDEHDIMNEHNT